MEKEEIGKENMKLF